MTYQELGDGSAIATQKPEQFSWPRPVVSGAQIASFLLNAALAGGLDSEGSTPS